MREEDFWAGPVHGSVENYGLTKKIMAVQGRAYKTQYGLDSIHLVLTNLYGPWDSYNPHRSHVVAALVRKFVEAKRADAAEVRLWGTGKPVREFLYVEDCADAIVEAAEAYNDLQQPLNIGTGIGTSIKELAETIRDVTGVPGRAGLGHRQAGRPGDEDPRSGAGAGDAGVASDALAARRPGQDHRLVRRAQGRGGRALVARRCAAPSTPDWPIGSGETQSPRRRRSCVASPPRSTAPTIWRSSSGASSSPPRSTSPRR